MKMKLIVSTTAFCIAFAVSIYNNLLWTSVKRSVVAFVIFYIVAAVLGKVLESEVQAFQKFQDQTDDGQENECTQENQYSQKDDHNLQAEHSMSDEKQQSITGEDAKEFEPIDFSKMAEEPKKTENPIDVDGLDPKLLANILNNFSDDPKSI